MRRLLAIGLLVSLAAGCRTVASWNGPLVPSAGVVYENPVMIPNRNHEAVWETVVDVLDDYFRIAREEPVQLVGNVLTEGRVDTFPQVGSTIFEPWHRDSANSYEKLESTLQSTRRRAVLRVIPAQNGFWVDVAVFKELEDVVQPARATAGAATFRYDSSLTRVTNPVGGQEINDGWIAMGRDVALQQRIIEHLLARTGAVAR